MVVGAGPGVRGIGDRRDVSPLAASVRSRVHEYGGGSATIADGVLFYVDQEDQDWYRMGPGVGDAAIRLTSTGGPGTRHADGRSRPTAGGWCRWKSGSPERGHPPGRGRAHRWIGWVGGAGRPRPLRGRSPAIR